MEYLLSNKNLDKYALDILINNLMFVEFNGPTKNSCKPNVVNRPINFKIVQKITPAKLQTCNRFRQM